jgi:transposase
MEPIIAAELDKETLSRLYVKEKLSLRAIAKMYDVSYFCVQYRCKQYGIKARPKTSKRIHIDKAILERLCIEEGKSSKEVAELLSCSFVTVRERCREHGVPLKGQQLKRITKHQLQKLYVTEKKSTREVAKVLGCSSETVRTRCRKFGIPLRKAARGGLKIDETSLKRLYLVEGRKMTDIAAKLGCSVATISNRLKEIGLTKTPTKKHSP